MCTMLFEVTWAFCKMWSVKETTELLGGTKENGVSPTRGHGFALQANQCSFTKRKQKKIELVARP